LDEDLESVKNKKKIGISETETLYRKPTDYKTHKGHTNSKVSNGSNGSIRKEEESKLEDSEDEIKSNGKKVVNT